MRFNSKRSSFALFAVAFLLLGTGCGQNATVPSIEYISIKNDILKVEVLAGSFATEECGIESDDLETEHFACVAFPFSSKLQADKNWDAEYLKALDINGWKWAGGEGNAYYLEKPKSNDCSYFLAMIGWVQGSQDEVKSYMQTGDLGTIENQTYIFALDDDLRCGDERNAEE